MKTAGNTILVTGATSGIGRGLAEALHAKGNQVIVAGRRRQLLDELTARCSGMVGIPVDLNDRGAIDRLAAEVADRFPALNVLINNAGISRAENYLAPTVDIAAAMAILQTNVASVIQLSAALLPHLRRQPHATLMATTSGLAFVPFPSNPTYSASKAFLHHWLEALRFQLRDSSVEVLELVPPYVQTELGSASQASDPRAMPLEDFVREVMQILEADSTEGGEILVPGVQRLRWAEKNGEYQQLLSAHGSFKVD